MVKITNYDNDYFPYAVEVTKGTEVIFCNVFENLQTARDYAIGRFARIDKEELK